MRNFQWVVSSTTHYSDRWYWANVGLDLSLCFSRFSFGGDQRVRDSSKQPKLWLLNMNIICLRGGFVYSSVDKAFIEYAPARNTPGLRPPTVTMRWGIFERHFLPTVLSDIACVAKWGRARGRHTSSLSPLLFLWWGALCDDTKNSLTCAQTSPLPQKKKMGFFSGGGGTSV